MKIAVANANWNDISPSTHMSKWNLWKSVTVKQPPIAQASHVDTHAKAQRRKVFLSSLCELFALA
jgi:hypothetical protein